MSETGSMSRGVQEAQGAIATPGPGATPGDSSVTTHVYVFAPGEEIQMCMMFWRLRTAGLHPTSGSLDEGAATIVLPQDELPRWAELREKWPEKFGTC